jgi:hypothetical protein
MVRLRHSLAHRVRPFVRPRGRLLARGNLDTDELVGTEGSQGEIHCGSRTVPGKGKRDLCQARHNVEENVFKVLPFRGARDRAYNIATYCQERERTEYVWEQYDAKTGQGRRSHPSTGGTSLVTVYPFQVS